MIVCNSYVVCKSYVVGQFIGYIGEEEYCLGDGSIWRITTPIYRIRRKQCPRATVFRKNARYFFAVKGMGEDVEVEAVHLPRFMLETPPRRPENQELQEQLNIPQLTKQALSKWHWCVAMANN